jgi:hypothetical protein
VNTGPRSRTMENAAPCGIPAGAEKTILSPTDQGEQ